MLVNQEVLENLCKDAGQKRTQRARIYKLLGRVEIQKVAYQDGRNFEISSTVEGSEKYKTYVSIHNGEVEDITCHCQDYYNHYGVCKHTLASVMALVEKAPNNVSKKEPKKVEQGTQYRNFKQIVNTFYNEEVEEIGLEEKIELKNKGTIKLEPQIIYDKFSSDMKVEFKIGHKRMYKIKDLSEFYSRMLNKEFYRYGEKLQFVHTKEMFEEESQKMLEFVMKYAEIIKYVNSNSNSNYRYYGKALSQTHILLGNSGIDDLFEILKGKKISFQKELETEEVELIDKNPKIEFNLKKVKEDQYVIVPNIEIFKISILRGKNYKYILEDKRLYRCNKEFESCNLRLLELFRQNYMTEVYLGKEQLSELFSIVIPKVKNAITAEEIAQEEIQKYQPQELEVKVYLDFDSNDYLIAEVKFVYGREEFNPLSQNLKLNFPRNIIKETKALNRFRKTGFMFDSQNLRFILPDDDKIYQFLTEDVNSYMQKFEVLATEKFKTKQIRQPKISSLGIKVENNLLAIDLKDINIEPKELEKIMEKYTLKKKYYRLKDGSFIQLEENKEIEFLNKLVTGMDINFKELEKEEIRLPVNRSLYLEQLLKGIKGTKVVENTEYRKIVNRLDKTKLGETKVPENLNPILRSYQKIGFKWLKILDSYRFGGILADDMGLRKNHSNVICYSRLCPKYATK